MHSPSTRFQLLLRLLVDVHWLSDPGSGSQGLNLRYARGARKSTWRERQQWWRESAVLWRRGAAQAGDRFHRAGRSL